MKILLGNLSFSDEQAFVISDATCKQPYEFVCQAIKDKETGFYSMKLNMHYFYNKFYNRVVYRYRHLRKDIKHAQSNLE